MHSKKLEYLYTLPACLFFSPQSKPITQLRYLKKNSTPKCILFTLPEMIKQWLQSLIRLYGRQRSRCQLEDKRSAVNNIQASWNTFSTKPEQAIKSSCVANSKQGKAYFLLLKIIKSSLTQSEVSRNIYKLKKLNSEK